MVSGQIKGETLLPLPAKAENLDEDDTDSSDVPKSLVHAIETAVIDWTHQVKNVLSRDSAKPLEEGHHPGPLMEVDFWNAMTANLKAIMQQLQSPKILKMRAILEANESTYATALSQLYVDVELALEEAADIKLYVHALYSLLTLEIVC